MQIEQHIQEAQRLATDPVQANKHTERANQLKQYRLSLILLY